jgi:predicted porin
MQKKLIALAIASLSGAAFADASNVTIYGVADGSFDVINVSGGNGAVDTPRFSRVSSNGSHIGLKGKENLGNGLSAIFQFESDANFDNGGSLNTNRDSFVGLTGNFGTVVLGTLTAPSRALAARLDVNSGESISSNTAVLGKLGGALSDGRDLKNTLTGSNTGNVNANLRSNDTTSVFDSRHNNAIAYVSPSFSGFQATAAYMANENKSEAVLGGVAAGINTSAYDLGLNYDNGPVMVGLTYAEVRVKNELNNNFTIVSGSGTDLKLKETRLGGMYDFGVATVRAMNARTKAESSDIHVKQNVWGIGGTYNVTANGKITAQYYVAKDLDDSKAGGDINDSGAKFYTLGYEHSLSKRTMLKAGYAYLKNDNNVSTAGGGYDFGYNSSGFTGDNVKVSGFQFGVRHAF